MFFSGRLKEKHYILGGVTALILAIISASVVAVLFLREQEIDTWRRELSDLSLVLAEQTSQSMSTARLAMDSIVERVDTMGVRNDADLRLKTKTVAMHQVLLDKISGLPQVDVATLVAANGDVINFTRKFPAPEINLADRDYFQAHLNNAELGLFISVPVRNKGNGKWVFYLSRRLNDAAGKLMGLVLIGVSVDKFTAFHQRLGQNLGEGAAITLLRRDFTVLTRWPTNDEEIGKKNLTGSSHLVVEGMKKNNAVIEYNGPRLSSNGMPVARLGAVQVLERFPMIVNLTVTEDFILENWRSAVKVVALVASASMLTLLLATYFLLRITLQRQKSTDLLNDLTDQVPGMLFQFLHSPDGRISLPYVNKEFINAYGLHPENGPLEGAALFTYLHPEDKIRISDSIQKSIQSNHTWHEDYRLVLPGKGVVWCHGDAQPQKLMDGSVLLHGYINDITESKLAEQALNRESEKNRTLLHNASDGIHILDPDGILIEVSDSFCAMLGYKRGEMIGMKAIQWDANMSESELIRAVRQQLEKSSRSQFETKHRRKDGSVFDVEISGLAIKLDGRVLLYNSSRDITERKRQERQIELEKGKAEAANRAKSDFLANMSHEIRTPMNAVIGLSDLALQSSDQNLQTEYLRQILESSRLLLGILNDILDFSKIEAGQIAIEKRVFDIDELVDSMGRLFNKSAQEKGLELSLNRHHQIPKLLIGDELRLRQILTNLVGNAIKFTEQGRVALEITRLPNEGSGIALVFTVQDSGIGITGEQIARLFRPFMQADTSTTRRFGGTGLGLSISRQLAQLMGGEIEVSSTPGSGTSFVLQVVLEQANDSQIAEYLKRREADKAPPEYRDAAQALRGKKVLLVEDNRVNQMVAKQMLKKLTMHTDVANNGEEAIKMLPLENYHFVLMDVQMPVMDGIEATRIIRQNPQYATLPIIAMSAGVTLDEQEECAAAGMTGFIGKPVDFMQLTNKLVELGN
jgi:PAS domain S-box-containing protein